jgi:hypothetical protein
MLARLVGLYVLVMAASPALALSGKEYIQLDAANRALHVMGMVEAMKYTDDLSGTDSLKWLFQCAGGWTGVQFEQVLSDYNQRNRYKLSYRTPSLLVSAVGSQCRNAPMWAR